jgi:hypothetical protein
MRSGVGSQKLRLKTQVAFENRNVFSRNFRQQLYMRSAQKGLLHCVLP